MPPHRSPSPTGRAAPHHLNSATPEAAEAALLTCCGSGHWARQVAFHRPYPDLEALLAASDEASYDLAPSDLAEALASEPLDPTVPHQGSHPAASQVSGSLGTYTAVHTALSAAHAAYESRFGHSFVICLDEAAPDEALDLLLSGIRSRLGNDPEEERAIAADELRRLARGRLARLTMAPASHDTDPAHDRGPGHAARETRPQSRPDSPYVPV
ncbi:2-oxo-4-hydroxy-4-carboxy-5-ureidoimidazoline decarboxylase [Streptomyces sp. NPDC087300]|uniref:2-oxo-4-hydroxy-4-carboxy-5-ureidoimidazoline decarboxylase n=1 Tax=Streptomyces sp. NPDC087300 TaxID=3365780 RepID=UPI003820D49B